MQPELVPMLTGDARYVADITQPDALHACFVRANTAHARLGAIDVRAAHAVPGVCAVLTADDLGLAAIPGFEWIPAPMARPPLAAGVVRFVGEPIAVVLATSLAAAFDGAEAVVVDEVRLPAVVDPHEAVGPDAPRLFEDADDNVAFRSHVGGRRDDALGAADVVVDGYFVHQRVSASPMETNSVLVVPDAVGLTMYASSQGVHTVRDAVAKALSLPNEAVRVIAPYVGGGFGAKFHVCIEYVVLAAAARHTGRAVRWTETRRDHLAGCSQGRGQYQRVSLGLRRDGTMVGLAAELMTDGGAYPGLGAVMSNATAVMAAGPYRLPVVSVDACGVVTNMSPTIAYRGAGRPEAAVMLERLVDLAGRELGMDPIELRRRNLLRADEFPYESPTGLRYDSGDYLRALDAAVRAIDYDDVRAEQRARRARRDPIEIGVGVAVYMDVTPFRLVTEYASVEVCGTAHGPVVTVTAGTCNFGQSHETMYARIVRDVLGFDRHQVSLVDRDTALVPRGIGSASARSAMIGGSAVHESAVSVAALALARAADLLEAAAGDVELRDGRFTVRGSPSRYVEWPAVLAEGPIKVELDWTQDGSTFPFGVHAGVVEVDTETGHARLRRFVAVDDCGRAIEPDVVDGQQQGGALQGIAAALFESCDYDGDGTPRATSLAEYLVPSAADVPRVETGRTETLSPLNPLGVKGIGQSGAIGAPGAVINAVLDALAARGGRDLNPPFTPERVWRALTAPPS